MVVSVLLLHLVIPLVREVAQLGQPARDVVTRDEVLELAPAIHLLSQSPSSPPSHLLHVEALIEAVIKAGAMPLSVILSARTAY